MLDRNNLVALMKTVAKADPSSPVAYSYNGQNLSYEALNDTLRNEMNELAGTNALYRENKNLIFSMIEETLDEVLPKKVSQSYEQFAEVKQFAQGDKPIFRRPLNTRARAKQFVTRVGLAGIYEVFKLGPAENESFEVRTSAIGGAAQIGFEEFLDGRVNFAEAGFDEGAMDRLITIASAYGTPTIYCTYEFAVRMIPNEAWRYTEAMKTELWNTGRLATYKGTKVVILEQGFEDESNTRKVIDPGYAWIIPTGVDGKPVKIAFEGGTIVDEFNNYDRSREIQVYKKVGVGCMLANNICSYVDTSLMGQMYTWNYDGITGKVVTYDGRLSGQI